jgi:hypothetical protein
LAERTGVDLPGGPDCFLKNTRIPSVLADPLLTEAEYF